MPTTMSGPALFATAALVALLLLVLGLRALAAAGRRMQQPATADTDQPADQPPGDGPAPIVEPPAEVDEWTTDTDLWLRLHTDLNHIEDTLRAGLDNTLARFVAALRLDEADLLEHPGFPGVRELVGVA